MTIRKLKSSLGFTLVELLIVIALLGAIALIVIAAINPIEQANRARDTRFKADAAQIVSAIDRYFATRLEFPWVASGVLALNNDDAFGFVDSIDPNVGICGTDCTTTTLDGELMITDELKSEFLNRDFIAYTGTDVTKKLFVGKTTGTSAGTHVCYVPASKATRERAAAEGNAFRLNATTGAATPAALDYCDPSAWPLTDMATACFVCIPE